MPEKLGQAQGRIGVLPALTGPVRCAHAAIQATQQRTGHAQGQADCSTPDQEASACTRAACRAAGLSAPL